MEVKVQQEERRREKERNQIEKTRHEHNSLDCYEGNEGMDANTR